MAGQIDLLGFISDIVGKRNQASEAAANRAFSAAEAEKGRQFTGAENAASRAAAAREFDEQQRLAREKFSEDTRRFGVESGMSQQQIAETIRQFNDRQALDRQKFDTTVGLDTRRLGNEEAQQQISNLSNLSQLVGHGTQNQGQADLLSLLAGRLGAPTPASMFLNSGTGGGGLRTRAGSVAGTTAGLPYRGPTTWDMISGHIPTPGPQWAQYLLDNPSNSGVVAPQPTAPGPSRLPRRY